MKEELVNEGGARERESRHRTELERRGVGDHAYRICSLESATRPIHSASRCRL